MVTLVSPSSPCFAQEFREEMNSKKEALDQTRIRNQLTFPKLHVGKVRRPLPIWKYFIWFLSCFFSVSIGTLSVK